MKCISNKSDKDKLHINNSYKGDVQIEGEKNEWMEQRWKAGKKYTKSFQL